MEAEEPLTGPGHFQWNRGGWFGGQLGSTAWMLVGSVVLAPLAPGVAGVWLVCFAVANAVGTRLWRRRDRVRPYPALQAQLAVCGACGSLALIALLASGPRAARVMGISPADEPRLILWLLVTIIAMMTWFHLMERIGTKKIQRP